MKDSLLNAQRWFRQAEHDLQLALRNLKEKFYSDACFMAEQAAQKALKAYLFFSGERSVAVHALVKLVEMAKEKDKGFRQLEDAAKVLDKYYIPTRYPDALPMPVAPYEAFNESEAKEAASYGREIVDLVRTKLQ